jgi:hypothetical protein
MHSEMSGRALGTIKKISLLALVGGLHYWGNRGANCATPQSSGWRYPASLGARVRLCYALIGVAILVTFKRCATGYMPT